MKKNPLFLAAVALATLVGLALSGCDTLEDGIGIIKLTNKSLVDIGYWSLEKDFGDSNPIWEERITLKPGESVYHEMNSAFGIKVYLEDSDDDGWISKYSYTVKKDQTVEVEFQRDFKPEP